MIRLLVIVLALVASPALASGQVTGIPRIVDGDTVEIAGTKIRLERIDAPESDQLCLDATGARWTCGIAVRDALVAKSAGRPWSCKASGHDRYRRTLATCSIGGEDVDRWMVRSGWALSFVRYGHTYDAEEKAAREARAGLWAGAFIAPWDWRGRTSKTVILGAAAVPANAQTILLGSASATEAPDPSCTIKGNTTRAGECIYHLPGGRSYARVNMDPAKGRRWFCSTVDAEAAGCRAAKQ